MGEGFSIDYTTPPEPEKGPAMAPEAVLVLEDHGALMRLLRQFECDARSAPRRASASMQAVLDFFHVHSRIEETIAGEHDHDALQYLIDMQECTAAGSRLYLTRGLELKRSLEAHMREEERCLHEAPRLARLHPGLIDEHAARRREAVAVLHRAGPDPMRPGMAEARRTPAGEGIRCRLGGEMVVTTAQGPHLARGGPGPSGVRPQSKAA